MCKLNYKFFKSVYNVFSFLGNIYDVCSLTGVNEYTKQLLCVHYILSAIVRHQSEQKSYVALGFCCASFSGDAFFENFVFDTVLRQNMLNIIYISKIPCMSDILDALRCRYNSFFL